MVQNAGCFDVIELSSHRAQFCNVGLCKFDVGEVVALRHALGIAQACHTQVNGENLRARRLSSEFDGGQSRPAAGKEGIECILRRATLKNYRFARWSCLYPAWVWAF